jgi:Flp pilus assembly protein TadG
VGAPRPSPEGTARPEAVLTGWRTRVRDGRVGKRPGRRRARGQSLVEIALTMPLFLVLTLGTADGGRAFYYRETVINATRQALREAVTDVNGVTQPYAGTLACASISSTPTAVAKTAHVPWQSGDTAYLTNIANAAALESSTTGAAAGSKISGATITVTWHCKNGVPINNAGATVTDPANVASDSVEVQISYSFSLLTPLVGRVFGSTTPTISADLMGRAEY